MNAIAGLFDQPEDTATLAALLSQVAMTLIDRGLGG